MKYTTNSSTRSVNIKITLQTGSPDHREIIYRIIWQSEDFSVDTVLKAEKWERVKEYALSDLFCNKIYC